MRSLRLPRRRVLSRPLPHAELQIDDLHHRNDMIFSPSPRHKLELDPEVRSNSRLVKSDTCKCLRIRIRAARKRSEKHREPAWQPQNRIHSRHHCLRAHSYQDACPSWSQLRRFRHSPELHTLGFRQASPLPSASVPRSLPKRSNISSTSKKKSPWPSTTVTTSSNAPINMVNVASQVANYARKASASPQIKPLKVWC